MSYHKLIIWGIKDLGEIYLFFVGPDPKNETLDLKIELSGPKNKNISNQKLGLAYFFICPDPKNEALDLTIEVSGPKNKHISNQKLGLIVRGW